MIPHSTIKAREQYYARLERQAEHERMNKELRPLYYLLGEEAYQTWVDTFITDSMSVDEIIKLAHQHMPECECTPIDQPCAACRAYARMRAEEAESE